MQISYEVTYLDGTTQEGVANMRDIAVWEINFSKNRHEIDINGMFFYEFAWLVYQSIARQDLTDKTLYEWLDTVDEITQPEADPLVPLDQTAPTGS